MLDILLAKLSKRNVDVRFLDRSAPIEKIGGDKVKQPLTVKSGIDTETAKKIQTAVKQSKLKVQAVDPGRRGARERGETRRVAGRHRADSAGRQRRTAVVQQLPRLMRGRAALLAAVLLWSGAVAAQTVSLSGSLGGKALLMIDGAPRTLAVGQSAQGVKLVSVAGSDAVVEVGGRRVKLQLGSAQVNLGGAPTAGGGTQIVLTAGSGGHFVTQGSINGASVRFVVDTGATHVALSQAEAERIGLNFRKGQRGVGNTANGQW